MELFYKKKYLKYKSKYVNSQKNIRGGANIVPIKAIAFFSNSEIKGKVTFEEQLDLDLDLDLDISDGLTIINVDLDGFQPNTIHGFHIHETGDLSKGCASTCAHFNPTNKTHGDRYDENKPDESRHIGDLGNLEADSLGKVNIQFTDKFIKLRGMESNIIGRGLVIHADPDDLGKGTHLDSKTTGHSGKRIACAIIGYASVC
jgi:Cu-Zn family superoxide dismutase